MTQLFNDAANYRTTYLTSLGEVGKITGTHSKGLNDIAIQ